MGQQSRSGHGFLRRHPLAAAAALLGIAGAVTVVLYFEPQKLYFDDEVSEAPPTATAGAAPRTIARGEFRSLAHNASGRARILHADGKRYLRIEDLDVSNGPDLKVYLSAAASSSAEESFDDDYASLGNLKGNIGDQNYELGPGVDLDRFRSAVVWCERFSTGFAVAPIEQ